MQQLAGGEEFSEHCGCEDDIAEGRAEAENAIWKFFPSDSKGKVGGHRKVMFTGNVAKAAKLPEYTSVKLSDLTDHQIKSVLAVIQKKGEETEPGLVDFLSYLREDQMVFLDGLEGEELQNALTAFAENMLAHEDTPDLVRHCVRSVAKKHGGDVARAFAICTASLQKSGHLEPGSAKLTAKGKEKEKEHKKDPDAGAKFADYEKMLKKARKKEDLDEAKQKVTQTNFGPKMGAPPKGLDWRARMAWAAGAEDPPEVRQARGQAWLDQLRKDAAKRATKKETVADRMRDLLSEAPKKPTYAQFHSDFMGALEKDGWSVKRDLKVPWAKSPDGKHKLWFKKQAVYHSRGDQDLGAARTLTYHDIRDYSPDQLKKMAMGGGGSVAQKLSAPAPKAPAPAAAPAHAPAPTKAPEAPAHQLTPDQYHAKHGQCPDGHHWDGKRCVKAGTEAVESPAVEVMRLSGVDRYPDRKLDRTERYFSGLSREYAGVARAHEGWRLK